MSTGTLTFETTIADWIRFIPEQPVVETWLWLSDVIGAWDSTEQRISVRRQPRRRIEASILLEDEIERQREYDRLLQRLGDRIVIPFYQYSTRITQDSLITATKIFFNPALTDFRDNDLAVIFRPSTEDSFLIALGTILGDGANTATPLTVDVKKGDIVAPAFNSRLDNRTAINMTTVSGAITFKALVEDFRSTFERPGSTAVIDTFDSLNVLDRTPLVIGVVPETFDVRPTIVDNEAGQHDQKVSWLHAFIDGVRTFNIKRVLDPTEMDYWRDFIVAARGQRNSFLMPSWREDLFLATPLPNPGDPSIVVTNTPYSTLYFPHDTYKRLVLVNPSAVRDYRKVTAVNDEPGGNVRLSLDTPVTSDLSWGNGFTIEYLNKVRLGSDQQKLTHFAMHTIFELVIRTTDQ